jgi:DNA-binding transcriptional ArsR family regulator
MLLNRLSHVRQNLRIKAQPDGAARGRADGDSLLASLAALANPHRLRIVAVLARDGRTYVSQLAREIGISRPLVHLHLQKLEEAGLARSQLELSADGKALNYFANVDFVFLLTPAAIAQAAQTLTIKT